MEVHIKCVWKNGKQFHVASVYIDLYLYLNVCIYLSIYKISVTDNEKTIKNQSQELSDQVCILGHYLGSRVL
jgi:hypothetical protein